MNARILFLLGLASAAIACSTTTSDPRSTGEEAISTGTTVKAGDVAVVETTDGLHLRDAPSVDGKILDTLPHVAYLKITGPAQNGWVPVDVGEHGDRKGWVAMQFIKLVDLATLSPDTLCLAHSRAGDVGDIFPVPFCKGANTVVTCVPGSERGLPGDPGDHVGTVQAVDACDDGMTFCMSMELTGGLGEVPKDFCANDTLITCAPGGQRDEHSPPARPLSKTACASGCANDSACN